MPTKKITVDPNLTAHDQAVRLMAGWVSAIADQVKNPVAGISAAATLIEKQMAAFRASQSWDPAIVEEAVRLMIGRLSRFDNYLSELSGFTREVKLQLKSYTLTDEWPSIEQSVVRKVPLEFRMSVVFPDHLQIYVDLERLTSCCSALVLNSVEACGVSLRPEIRISASQHLDEKTGLHGVMIRVEDNGPGFSQQALLEGLTPFFTTKDAGTGLGLAMIEKYVRAHGGWVKLNNLGSREQPLGAVVELFFPSP